MADLLHLFGGRPFVARPLPFWHSNHQFPRPVASNKNDPLPDQWRLPFEAGWSVFPLANGSKRPLEKWEQYQRARPSFAEVAAWCSRDSNTAIVTGSVSGLVVLDLDSEAAIAEAMRRGVPATVEVQTPRGRHLYFRAPEFVVGNRAGFPFDGADVRGEGGYVVAPGSWFRPSSEEIAEGKVEGRYSWLRSPDMTRLAECPTWLLEALQPESLPSTPGGNNLRRDAWALRAVSEEIERVRNAPSGQRNVALNRAAFKLGQLEEAIDRERVRADLLAAAIVSGLSAEEASRTLESGWRSGRENPRAQGQADFMQVATSLLPTYRPLRLSPLERPHAAPPLFPLDVFGSRWSDWIVQEASEASAPADYVAMGLLVSAAALIGNARKCSPWNGWEEPTILWGCIIGEPSAGKTPALRPVQKLLDPINSEFASRFSNELAEYNRAVARAEVAKAKWKKEASGQQGPIPPMPREAEPPCPPTCGALRVDDVTPEKLGSIAEASPKGLLLFRDELAGWAGDMDRYSGGSGERALWLTAYNGDVRQIDRQKSPKPIVIDHFSVSILGGIQPDRFNAAFLGTVDDGLMSRFLFSWPLPVPRKRPEPRPAGRSEWAKAAVHRLFGVGFAQDENGESAPRVHRLSPDAALRFNPWWVAQAKNVPEGLAKSNWGKMQGQVLRIALVLEFLRWSAEGDEPEPREVSDAAVADALRLMDTYFKPMALRVFGEASIPPDVAAATKLAEFIKARRIERFNVRELQRGIGQLRGRPAALSDHARLTTACEALVDAGWLVEERSREGEAKGRQRLDYRVNPELWKALKGEQ